MTEFLAGQFDIAVIGAGHAGIEAARAVGMSGAESDYYERNARNILTTWGDRDQSLNDYANRTWAGLVATYYKPRWELFCDAVLEAVESDEPFDEAAFTERCKDDRHHFRVIVSPEDAADLTVTALAGGITELDFGDVTRGALCDAVPAG